MEYSLTSLEKHSNLSVLTLAELIEKLNMIGFEMDNLTIKPSGFSEKIQVFIKIPANREDLLLEKNLIKEFSTLFLFNLYQKWEKVKKNYFFLIKQKYFQYFSYQQIEIDSNLSSLLVYTVLLKKKKEKGSFLDFSSSPLWIQNKLETSGIIPKKNYKDLIDLINLEWGQSFSLLSIPFFEENSSVSVKNEKIFSFLLEKIEKKILISQENEKDLELFPGTIIFREKEKEEKIFSILGTKKKVLEKKEKDEKKDNISFFLQGIFYDIYENPLQFDSRKTNLSYRSFRKIFLENFKFSFQRLLTLFEIIYDFSLCSKIYIKNEKSVQLKNKKIIKIKFISFLFFLNIPKEKIDFSIFEKASLKKICQTETECYFSIPTFRNDLNREIDLIEEYCRFLGYQEIQEILPKKYIFSGENKKENKKWIKEFFFNHSFFEVLTNSLDEKENKNSLFLKNPLNKEFTLLRTSLLPKILEIFEFNLRTNLERKNYFEIGRVFLKENKKIIEIEKIAGLFQLERNKKTKGPNTEWFLAKGFIEKFCLSFGYEDITFELVSSKDLYLFPFSHQKNTIFLKYGTIYLGIFGQLNSFTKSFEQKYPSKYSTYFFELNLMAFPFSQLKSKIKPFLPFSKYPTISKDFSFIIQKNIEFSKIKKEIWQICGFLKKVEFFDIYFDQLSIEKVNIGIRLVFQSNKETLTIEMIEKELIKVKTILIQKFQVEFKE